MINPGTTMRCLTICAQLKRKGRDNLTDIEVEVAHLLREFGILYFDCGNEGTSLPVIRSWSDNVIEEETNDAKA